MNKIWSSFLIFKLEWAKLLPVITNSIFKTLPHSLIITFSDIGTVYLICTNHKITGFYCVLFERVSKQYWPKVMKEFIGLI